MKELLEYCRDITRAHLETHSIEMLYYSTVEELGEIARALKIENKAAGTANKELDEDSKSECVDLYICAAALWVASGISDMTLLLPENHRYHQVHDDTRKYLSALSIPHLVKDAAQSIGRMDPLSRNNEHDSLKLAEATYPLFLVLGGTQDEFEATMKAKLDKWNNNLKP